MGQWRFVMVGFDPMTFLWLRVLLQVGNKMNICWNQVSLYKGGEQTGPAKFTWPNGAVREGSKVGFLSWTFNACQHTCQSSKSFKLLVPAIVKSVASSGERSLGRWMLLHLQWGTKGWKTRRWEVRIQFQLFDLGKILSFKILRWKDGELVSSVKHHGDGKQFVVQVYRQIEKRHIVTVFSGLARPWTIGRTH